MLRGKHVVIFGGDARQLEIIRKLLIYNAKLSLIGFDRLDDSYTGASKKTVAEMDWSDVDAIILPVHGSQLDGTIDSIFSDKEEKLLVEHLQKTPEHCLVFTGISNRYLDECTERAKRKLIKLMDRDDIAIYNSIPTAEGAIMMAIQHMDITIHRSKVVVIGLGRVGMTVARAFDALGAKVSVVARRADHLARITEMGLDAYSFAEMNVPLRDVDLLINTVPAPVVTKDVLANMPLHALIIDLASKPGGVDFEYAEKRGIKALLAPSLPGIVAPKTAGQILADTLATLIKESATRR
mgnify:CR=1 FL=1